MKPAFTFQEIREVEKTIIEKDGIPSLILMENAGRNSFDVLCGTVKNISSYSVYIFCGKGNNAGDGFVIARHLAVNGIESNVILVTDPSELTGDALINFRIIENFPSGLINISRFDFNSKKNPAGVLPKGKLLFIDSVLGSGIKGKLSNEFELVINFINEACGKNKNCTVISVDVPSGLTGTPQVNPVIRAGRTITMGAVKTELLFSAGKENSGDVTIVPIGIPDEFFEMYNKYRKYDVEFHDIKNIFPVRKKTSYKYSNGKALIIGGSKGLSGAVIMSSLSALKSGAGAVFAAYPESLSPHFGKKLFEVIKTELDETPEGSIAAASFGNVKKHAGKSDAALIGPGLSLNNDTKSFLFEFIEKYDKPLIIDADALTLISEDVSVLLKRQALNRTIITPHIGEFSALCGLPVDEIKNNRFNIVREFSAKYSVYIVMKSETTFCCTPDGNIYINSSGNELLASAGSGDVLSGIMVSLLAQTGDVYRAMLCGTYLHGLVADIWGRKYGNKQTAAQQDLVNTIPKAVSVILS